MKLNCAAVPQTYKIKKGLRHLFREDMIEQMPKEISLSACRNSTVAFQVLLTCDEGVIYNIGSRQYFAQRRKKSVRLVCDSALECSFNHLEFIPDDEGFLVDDILGSSPVCEAEANSANGIYVEAKIPSDFTPGDYEITLDFLLSDMFSCEECIGSVTAKIRVYDFVLPSKKENGFFLDLWQHNCNIARQYEVEAWSDEHFAILENYIKSLGEVGVKTATVIASDTPWSGQWCHLEQRASANLYEYSIISTVKEKDGGYSYDYSAMQRYIDLCNKYGVDGEISVYGLVNVWCDGLGGFDPIAKDHADGIKLRYFDHSDKKYKYMDKGEDIDAYIKALLKYFEDTNQMEKVRLVADEPHDTEAYRKITNHLKELAPNLKIKAALNHSEFIKEFGDVVTDFVPSLRSLSKEFDMIKEYQKTMKDSRFTWYVCNNPHQPNAMLRNDLCETLFLGVLTSYWQLEGFLRWNYTVWTDEPRKSIAYFNWPAGDLCFVYPGKNGKPLYSLRLKALCRAIELSILLNAYRECGKDATPFFDRLMVEKNIEKYYVDDKIIDADKICSLEYADYEEVKEEILKALS